MDFVRVEFTVLTPNTNFHYEELQNKKKGGEIRTGCPKLFTLCPL